MASELIFKTLDFEPHSFGLILRYLSQKQPFAGFELGATANTVLQQLSTKTHMVATVDDKLVAYAGWMITSIECAKAWVNNDAPLVHKVDGVAAAATVFACNSNELVLPFLREIKLRHPGLSCYSKRFYADGRKPIVRIIEKKSLIA